MSTTQETVFSPLCQKIKRNGVSIEIDIFQDEDERWILTVLDEEDERHVWNQRFQSDQEALVEAKRVLDVEPMRFALFETHTRARRSVFLSECKRRGVRFLPKQVVRPIFAAQGINDGGIAMPVDDDVFVW